MDSPNEVFDQKVAVIAKYLGKGERLITITNGTSSREEIDRIVDKVGTLLIKLEVYADSVGIYSKKKSIIEAQWKRYAKLVHRPTKEIAEWVRACLKLPVCIVEGASLHDSEKEQSELVDFSVIDCDGNILFQEAFRQDNNAAMPHVWAKLLATLEGKYVLSYDLTLIQMQLAMVADYYHLNVPPLIGTSLAPMYDLYFGVLPLRDTCMDEPEADDMVSRFLNEASPVLPALPGNTALNRARSMLFVLNSIAQDAQEVDGEQTEDDTGQFEGKGE